MNDDNSIVSAATNAPPTAGYKPFGLARECVFPLRFHDLAGSPLIELWDLQQSGRAESLVHSPATLAARLAAEPRLKPGAFIFHCSRCGSTLLARLFATVAANRVFDEPDAFHQLRDADGKRPADADSLHTLKVLTEAFGLRPGAAERQFIIKFDSRAVLLAAKLRQCFPDVPIVYLLRDPAEVVASLNARPPGFLAPENRPAMAATFGSVDGSPADYSPEEWQAWYVERNLRIALENRRSFTAVLDHAGLQTSFLPLVSRISGTLVEPSHPHVQAVLRQHSKFPAQAFAPKTSPAATTIRHTVDRIATNTYREWKNLLTVTPTLTGD